MVLREHSGVRRMCRWWASAGEGWHPNPSGSDGWQRRWGVAGGTGAQDTAVANPPAPAPPAPFLCHQNEWNLTEERGAHDVADSRAGRRADGAALAACQHRYVDGVGRPPGRGSNWLAERRRRRPQDCTPAVPHPPALARGIVRGRGSTVRWRGRLGSARASGIVTNRRSGRPRRPNRNSKRASTDTPSASGKGGSIRLSDPMDWN